MSSFPGKRFSQVELVAVMSTLFKDHAVEPVPKKGESLDMARGRLDVLAKDIKQTLLHEIGEPEKAAVRWFKR
jgi:hypothetical protein